MFTFDKITGFCFYESSQRPYWFHSLYDNLNIMHHFVWFIMRNTRKLNCIRAILFLFLYYPCFITHVKLHFVIFLKPFFSISSISSIFNFRLASSMFKLAITPIWNPSYRGINKIMHRAWLKPRWGTASGIPCALSLEVWEV